MRKVTVEELMIEFDKVVEIDDYATRMQALKELAQTVNNKLDEVTAEKRNMNLRMSEASYLKELTIRINNLRTLYGRINFTIDVMTRHAIKPSDSDSLKKIIRSKKTAAMFERVDGFRNLKITIRTYNKRYPKMDAFEKGLQAVLDADTASSKGKEELEEQPQSTDTFDMSAQDLHLKTAVIEDEVQSRSSGSEEKESLSDREKLAEAKLRHFLLSNSLHELVMAIEKILKEITEPRKKSSDVISKLRGGSDKELKLKEKYETYVQIATEISEFLAETQDCINNLERPFKIDNEDMLEEKNLESELSEMSEDDQHIKLLKTKRFELLQKIDKLNEEIKTLEIKLNEAEIPSSISSDSATVEEKKLDSATIMMMIEQKRAVCQTFAKAVSTIGQMISKTEESMVNLVENTELSFS